MTYIFTSGMKNKYRKIKKRGLGSVDRKITEDRVMVQNDKLTNLFQF